MGSAGTRFGRNVPLEHTYPETEPRLLTPNPRAVSRELHDARRVRARDDAERPRGGVDPVRGARLVQPRPERPRRAVADPARGGRRLARAARWGSGARRGTRRADPARRPQTWRDARHALVGRLADLRARQGLHRQDARRARAGSCASTPTGCCRPTSTRRSTYSDVPGTHWIGLAVLHTLFTLEHNAICDRLHGRVPDLEDDQLYDRARLINAALMAKIHTVEWTPAIIAHPTTVIAMRAQLVGPRRRAGDSALRPHQRRARSSAASRARRPTTTACRTR